MASAAACALLLAGCQSNEDVLPAGKTASPAAGKSVSLVVPPTESVGSAGTVIGMISVRDPASFNPEAERNRRDGAGLAVRDLGAGKLRLEIAEAAPSPEEIEKTTRLLAGKGAKLIVANARPDQLPSVRAALTGRDVAVVTFNSNEAKGPAGTWSFASSEWDGLIEALSFTVAGGKTTAVGLAPPGTSPAGPQRLAAGLKEIGATYAGTIEAGPGGVSANAAKLAAKADIVVVLPGLTAPATALKALAAASPPPAPRAVVVPPSLDLAAYGLPELSGAVACRFDQAAHRRIGKAFLAQYGRPVSMEAAYGYDAAALAAGLVRARGDDSLTPEDLTAPTGFVGALGVFRLRPDGTVQRTCDIYKVLSGKLQFFHPAPQSF